MINSGPDTRSAKASKTQPSFASSSRGTDTQLLAKQSERVQGRGVEPTAWEKPSPSGSRRGDFLQEAPLEAWERTVARPPHPIQSNPFYGWGN